VEKPKANLADLSLVQRKLRDFLDRMEVASLGNRNHPRKPAELEGGAFFMPMLFGEDIVFDPFDSNIYENSGAMHMGNMNRRDGDPTTDIDGDKVVINNHDFSDVTEAVRKSQAKDAAVLLKQLYNTSPVKGSTDDWTQVVRVDRVDWSAFFRMEEEMNRHEEVEFVDTSEMDFLETMARARARKMSSIILPRSRGTADGVVASLPIDVASGNVFGYEGHKIVPLPFGKVITSAIEPETYQFYQVLPSNLLIKISQTLILLIYIFL